MCRYTFINCEHRIKQRQRYRRGNWDRAGFCKVGTRDVNDPRNHLYLEYYRVVNWCTGVLCNRNVSGLLTLSNGMFRDDV